jgi:hypothetical protein
MAAWQFDVHLLPLAEIITRYRAVPIHISKAELDRGDWWKGVSIVGGLKAELSGLLPRLATWNNQIERWGTEDGNRIEFMREDDSICDVWLRFDVRGNSYAYLSDVVQVARRHECMLRTEDGKVFRPSVTRLLTEIHGSTAFRFVESPEQFMKALETARDGDTVDIPPDT